MDFVGVDGINAKLKRLLGEEDGNAWEDDT
jgi:hypothetical protein